MRTWHKAVILGVTTECVTTALFVLLRESRGILFMLSLGLHIPALVLIWLELPLVPSLTMEAALWVFLWNLLLSVFSAGDEELTQLSLSGGQSERTTNE
jgi:hypothetical protein